MTKRAGNEFWKGLTNEKFAAIWANPLISVNKIAEMGGVRPVTVSRRAQDLGLPSRRYQMRATTAGREQEFRKLWLANVDAKDIATEFGLSKRSVFRLADTFNLPLRQTHAWVEYISLADYERAGGARQ